MDISGFPYLSTYVRIMEKSSTPAVARATILAILVLVLCFLFVMVIYAPSCLQQLHRLYHDTLKRERGDRFPRSPPLIEYRLKPVPVYASGVWSESPLLLRRGLDSPPSGLKLAV